MENHELTMTQDPVEDISGRVISAIDLGVEEESGEEENAGEHPNFIESNTQAISLEDLTTKCIVPTFSDNTLTISHQNFIACVAKAAGAVYGEITPIEIRVSHPINGRVPEALYKKDSELSEADRTLFYQRMAFVSHIASLTRIVNGQEVHLCFGGVRAYNEDRLYARKAPMKFKIFVGWQVKVCSNLMLTCSGNSGVIECLTEADVYQKAFRLFSSFNPDKENQLKILEDLHNTKLTEEQFCHIVGRLRLYQFLPNDQKTGLPEICLGDQIINAAVKGFVENPNFGTVEGPDYSCYSMMQNLNEAAKASYIDKWLDRNQNCTDFAIGISKYLAGDSSGACFGWFLS